MLVEAHELRDVQPTLDTPWDELKYRVEFRHLTAAQLEDARVRYVALQAEHAVGRYGGLPWFPFRFVDLAD
jgi:hypothetical protein